MDEILIEEKKYISSKRAAKITGYAKDYIGQLCREGRVPARFVGRTWYVLESAIQDHRFGDSEIELEKPAKTEQAESVLSSTWESPRYESSSEEILPSINRLRTKPMESQKIEQDVPQDVQDSWRAWFDRFDRAADTIEQEEVPVELEKQEEEEMQGPKEEKEEDTKEEDTSVHIPIRTLFRAVPADLLPYRLERQQSQERQEKPTYREEPRARKTAVRTIQVAGAVVAMIVAIVAVIGSGYFDAYILSNSQARIIAGVVLYNK